MEVTRDSEVMQRVKENDGAGSGVDADTLDGKTSSDFLASGCRPGFTAFAGGRLCVSQLMQPAPFYNGAVPNCRSMQARVGNSNDVMLTFTDPSFNYFGGMAQGWLADHAGDDMWGTWNVTGPPANGNFDGPFINVVQTSAILTYRCVY
jgi:hypothetical protein